MAVCLLVPSVSSAFTLPDSRVWEQVTPVDKNGNDVPTINFGSPYDAFATDDGSGIAYSVTGAFGDAAQSLKNSWLARRSPSGWASHAFTPAIRGDIGIASALSTDEVADDGATALIEEDLGQPLVDGASPNGSDGVYLENTADDSITWLARPTTANPVAPASTSFVDASRDMGHVVFQANPASAATGTVKLIDADATRLHGSGLYEWDHGQVRPVGILPDGSVPQDGAIAPVGGRFGSARPLDGNNEVSQDGSHILFVSPDPAVGAGTSELYVRVHGTSTVLVSRQSDGAPSPDGGTFDYASPDGSKVWFHANSTLTPDAPPTATDTYEFDVASRQLTYAPHGAPVASSTDGRRSISIDATGELWFNDGSNSVHVASGLTTQQFFGAQAADDGSRFIFQTRDALSSDFNSGGFSQVYLYDASSPSHALSCISCAPVGVTPSNDATFTAIARSTMWPSRGISADGQRVFFQTPDPLVAGDLNRTTDVYEWENGTLSLVSRGGGAPFASVLLGSGKDGDDVFFATRDKLADADFDTNYDIYDARARGGIASPPPPPRQCTGDCQGPATPTPFLPVPLTSAFEGTGNVSSAGTPTFSVPSVSAAARRRLARTGAITLAIHASAAGKVSAKAQAQLGSRWTSAGSASKTLGKAGTVKLTLRLSKRARAYLAKHPKVMHVRIDVSYSKSKQVRRAAFVIKAAKPAKAHKATRSRSHA